MVVEAGCYAVFQARIGAPHPEHYGYILVGEGQTVVAAPVVIHQQLSRQTLLHHRADRRAGGQAKLKANETFAFMRDHAERAHDGIILQTPEVQVEAITLVHHGLCLGYVVREPVRQSVDMRAIEAAGLQPSPWLAALKTPETLTVEIGGVLHNASELRLKFLHSSSGESVAYLTDFLADEAQRARIAPRLAGVDTLYAEAQYAVEDAELAQKYHHSTVDQIAQLAREAGVGR
jgi:ribonuclease Z